MLAWPPIKFVAQLGSFSLQLTDGKNVSSTEMDSGMVRDRRRFTNAISPTKFSIELNSADVAVFKYFYKEIVKSGTLWFLMPIFDGTSYRTNLVKFDAGNPPTVTPVGYDWFTVSLSLLVKDLTQIGRDEYEWAIGDGSEDLADVVSHYVNVVYPAIVANK